MERYRGQRQNNKGDQMKTYTIKMSEATHTAIKVMAAKQGKSMQELIQDAIDDKLKEDE